MSIQVAIHTTRRYEKFKTIVRIIKEEIARPEEVEFRHTPTEEDVRKIADQIDILVCYTVPREAFEQADRLSWIHIGTAGIDHTSFPELLKSDVIVTNASGLHAEPASEFVMAQMLYFAKHIDEFRRFKESRQWNQWELAAKISLLDGKSIGIVGLGSIGKAIAKKARAFGMHVIATKYSVAPEDQYAFVDRLLSREQLPALLRESDFVVLTLPLTSETEGLIDQRAFYQMKSSTYLINISRGPIVDENALILSLKQNRIAGAALDVFREEPLPENSPLFGMDNVLLSPHISGNFPEYVEWASRDFGKNLNRFLSGKRLKNIVNKERGY
ncbi:MAG: D-2-hydroxyacid dehydrogenase [Candidatus Marinimicrobia bacterium]|nr:D-2-hydroxyacid dehydrogenase [Candidatus Neomarinimicrobiota bacterium]MCF7829884.1 D-2-hydroxyacid dehydrogenase [Candidatus Neomarinimicrobiota bacterium]MCF7879153.1 D-2-hydroxyacid dehydrogenase [Candidatus Neomarinimicrobiota bacterium]